MVKYTQVTINGDVITNANIIQYYVDETDRASVNTFNIELLPRVKDELTSELQTFQEVIIQDGYITSTDTYRIRGYITNINDSLSVIKIEGTDKLIKGVHALVNEVYISGTDPTGGIISEIVKDLLDNSGLSYTSDTIDDSTTAQGTLLAEFKCKDADPLERIRTLSEQIDWVCFYNSADDLCYFKPKGYTSNNKTIYVGGTLNNVIGIPKWNFDGKDMFNFAKVTGALDLFEQPGQLFNGDASETDFTLAGKNAEIVKVEYDAAGGTSYTTLTGGKSGSSDTYDYSFSKETNTVTFTDAPLAGTNNVRITPTIGEPTPVEVDDPASIAKYGVTIKKTLTFTDITNVSDVEMRASNMLNSYKEEFVSTTLKMKPSVLQANNYAVGQIVPVVENFNTKIGSRDIYIRAIRRYYPEKDLTLEVGDLEYRTFDLDYDTVVRLKRLEEQAAMISQL